MVLVRLNSKGMRELLQSPDVQALVDDVAEEIADNARGLDPEVEATVESLTTDRAVARVFVEPGNVQAIKGTLTRAAAQAGLEIKDQQ